MIRNLIASFRAFMDRNERRHLDANAHWSSAHPDGGISSTFPTEIQALALDRSGTDFVDLILLNDDITPMDYVVHVLTGALQIERERAVKLMTAVHTAGSAAVIEGIPRQSAITLTKYLEGHANSRGYPLNWRLQERQR